MPDDTITTTLTWGPFERIRRDGSLNHLIDHRVRNIVAKAEAQGYAVAVLRDDREVRVLATRTDARRLVVQRVSVPNPVRAA